MQIVNIKYQWDEKLRPVESVRVAVCQYHNLTPWVTVRGEQTKEDRLGYTSREVSEVQLWKCEDCGAVFDGEEVKLAVYRYEVDGEEVSAH